MGLPGKLALPAGGWWLMVGDLSEGWVVPVDWLLWRASSRGPHQPGEAGGGRRVEAAPGHLHACEVEATGLFLLLHSSHLAASCLHCCAPFVD